MVSRDWIRRVLDGDHRGDDMQWRLGRRRDRDRPGGVPGGLPGEPMAALAVEAVDGERPKPPSPAFPSGRPRYIDGGAFPLASDRRAGTNRRS
jgi:hypothetical protein